MGILNFKYMYMYNYRYIKLILVEKGLKFGCFYFNMYKVEWL